MSRSAINPVAFGISREAIREGLNTLLVGGRAFNVRKSAYPTSSNSTLVHGRFGPSRSFVRASSQVDRYDGTHLQVAGARPCSLLVVWTASVTPAGSNRYLISSGKNAGSSGAGIAVSNTAVSAIAANSSIVEVSVATATPTVGETYVSVLTAGEYLRLYHKGALIGETAISGGGPRTTTSAKTVSVGSDISTNYADAYIYLAAEFDAEIPQAYALSLAKDPWQVLTPPTRRDIFSWGSVVGGGGVSADGSLPSLSLSAPTGSATGAAAASGAVQALSLSPATGTASGNASAAGSLQALSLTTPEGSATGASAASAGIQALSISAPSGDATGSCSTSGEVPAVSLSAPTGTAFSGAGTVADGALAAIGLTAPSGSATGRASASGDIIGLSLSALAGSASGASSCSGSLPAISITACNGTATGTAPASRASAAPVFCRIVRPVTTVRLASNSHVVRVPDGH